MSSFKTIPSRTRPFLIFFIMAVVFHSLWNHSVILGDSYRLFAPHKFLIAQALKSWDIYAWYPWQRRGVPFVGDILAGWFYPPNLIYLLFPFGLAHSVFIFVHYPLAAIFMDLFLRRRGVDRSSALLGGVAFSLSGYMVSQHNNAAFLIGPTWAPLAVYCMNRALEGPVAWAFGVAAVLTVQVFAGDPQSAFITAFIVFLMGMISAFDPTRRRTALRSIAISSVFPVLLGAAQWMPTYELMRLSTRAAGVSFKENAMFSFHPGQMIELVWPAPFGRLWPDFFYWAKFALDNTFGVAPWSISNYMGFSVFILAMAGLIYSRRPWRIWVGLGAFFFLLLAFGDNTPLYATLYRVMPLFRIFRYPAKYMAWFSGFMAVAAALGLEQVQLWLEKSPRLLTRSAIVYMAVVIAFIGGAAFIWPPVIEKVTGLDPTNQSYLTIKAYLQHTGAQFLFVNLACGLILLSWSKKILPNRVGMPIFFAILILDYYLTNVTAIPVGPTNIYNLKSVASEYINENNVATLGQYRVFKEGPTSPAVKQGFQNYRLPYVEWLAVWQRKSLVPNLQVFEGFEEISGYSPIRFADDKQILRGQYLGKLLELYNVNYILSPYFGYQPMEDIESEKIAVDQQNDLVITRLVNAWPRAYWVQAAKTAPEINSARTMLDTSDLKKYVILITRDNINLTDAVNQEMKAAKIVTYEPDHVVIETDTESPGWLALSDRYYPGWRAFVDGKPVKIYKANLLVRAIPLEQGYHKVDFVYLPAPLRIGMCVSTVSWIILVAIFANARIRAGPRKLDARPDMLA